MDNKLLQKLERDIEYNTPNKEIAYLTTQCLIIKPVNKWIDLAKKRPIPNMLFSEFWYENELGILYADTNVGKSILAVQIAESISSGVAIEGFKITCLAKNVLYLDFELTDKQFEKRYSDNYKYHYHFHSNFKRAELNPFIELPKEFKSMEDMLIHQLRNQINIENTEVLIIDNLTYLNNDNEKAKNALNLMKELKTLTKEKNISILVLAHTPKRDATMPISKNDLAGSKMLINFCDSAFAIGSSCTEPSVRYLKQIKQRNTEQLYHGDNVIVCRIQKETNFLGFNFLEYGAEHEHLKKRSNELDARDAEMMNLIAKGLSNVKIAEHLGVSEGAIRKRRKACNI